MRLGGLVEAQWTSLPEGQDAAGTVAERAARGVQWTLASMARSLRRIGGAAVHPGARKPVLVRDAAPHAAASPPNNKGTATRCIGQIDSNRARWRSGRHSPIEVGQPHRGQGRCDGGNCRSRCRARGPGRLRPPARWPRPTRTPPMESRRPHSARHSCERAGAVGEARQ